jgi:hypothetical protein
VQQVIRHFHRARSPLIFFKLDIARAFDSVSWPYLLSMLRARGFSVEKATPGPRGTPRRSASAEFRR